MRLQDCINFQLAQVQNAVLSYFKSRLASYDFTPSQYALLSCLWEKGDQSPTQIAQALCLDTSSITGLLTRTEAKGLIQRQFSKEDRRTVIVRLTVKGASLREPITALIDDANKVIMDGISAEEKEELKKCFSTLVRNVQKNMD